MTRDGQAISRAFSMNEAAAEHWAAKERRARRRFRKLAACEQRHDPRTPAQRFGRRSLGRAIAAALFIGTVILTGPGCDEGDRKRTDAKAEARAARAEQLVQVERSKREQAELSVRKAEDGRAFWLAAAAIGTVAALVIGTGMRSRARADLHKQQHDGNGQHPVTERFQERV